MKTVTITDCTFTFTTFFTRSSAHGIRSQRFGTTASAKVTAQNNANRAGATALFCERSAQKVSWRRSCPHRHFPSLRFARLHARAQDFVRQDV